MRIPCRPLCMRNWESAHSCSSGEGKNYRSATMRCYSNLQSQNLCQTNVNFMSNKRSLSLWVSVVLKFAGLLCSTSFPYQELLYLTLTIKFQCLVCHALGVFVQKLWKFCMDTDWLWTIFPRRAGSWPTPTLLLQLSRTCGTWVKPWDRKKDTKTIKK